MAAAAKLDLILLSAGKGQFGIWALSSILAYSGGVIAILLLATRFGGIAGWSVSQLTFLMGYSMAVNGLQNLLFDYNIIAVSRRIGRGQMDHSLVQPQPLVLTLLSEGFSPIWGMLTLGPAMTLMAFGSRAADLEWSPALVGVLGLSLLSSVLLVLSASFAIGSAAFVAPRGAEEISNRATGLIHLTNYPLDALGPAFRTALLTFIPTGFVAWFPAGTILGMRPLSQWVLTPIVALVAASIATAIFRAGLRHYRRTGSSRYLTFGHRR